MDEVIKLITSVGFPIAMCLLLFWQNVKLSATINNNTKALEELKDIITSKGSK